MKDTYYFIIKLRQKLIRFVIENEEMFNGNEVTVDALPMIEIINNLDEMELLEFYLSFAEVEERDIFILIDRIKEDKGTDLPF